MARRSWVGVPLRGGLGIGLCAILCATIGTAGCAAPAPAPSASAAGGDAVQAGVARDAERLPLQVGEVLDASNGRLGLDGPSFRRAVAEGLARTVDFKVLSAQDGEADTAASGAGWGVLFWGWGDGASAGAVEIATAEVFVDTRTTDAGQRELEVALQVALPRPWHGRLGTDAVEAFVVVERIPWSTPDEGRAAVADALGIAVGVAEARLALSRVDRARITRLLVSPDDHQVQLVLEWLATNPQHVASWPERGAFAGLAAWYAGSTAPGVASAAVAVVAQLGDRRHVPTLLSRVSLVDDLQALRTYDALAILGGADAVAFLDFAARNERTLERRRAASRALAAIEAVGRTPPHRGATPRDDTRVSPPVRAGDRRTELTSLRGHR